MEIYIFKYSTLARRFVCLNLHLFSSYKLFDCNHKWIYFQPQPLRFCRSSQAFADAETDEGPRRSPDSQRDEGAHRRDFRIFRIDQKRRFSDGAIQILARDWDGLRRFWKAGNGRGSKNEDEWRSAKVNL